MVELIYNILEMSILVYGIYYIITGIFAFFGRKSKIRKYSHKNKIAVLIAARNESKVIGKLVESLKKQKYPEDKYDIYVIPNNCTDNTREVAMNSGAKIIDCTVEVSSKGEVLRFAFDHIFKTNDTYDAFCIFDADNIVHPEFLSRMNDAICAGYRVAQGYRDSKNPYDSWVSSCYSIFYWVQNYFFNKARMNMGWSSSINGTGFMVKADVIKEFGFNTETITEDIEFAAQCACNNCRIAFVKNAITYDEQPIMFNESWKQRKRWSKGTLQCLVKYFKPLLKKAIKSDVPQGLDMAMFFLAPVMQVLAFVVIAVLLIYNILSIPAYDVFRSIYAGKIILALIVYCISIIISAFVVSVEKKKTKKSVVGILTMGLFMLTWLPINIICMFNKKQVWEPIEHTKSMDIENIESIESIIE